MDHDTTPAADTAVRRDPNHAFAELALLTVNTDPPGQTLHRVAELAKQSLTGVEDVSLTMIDHGRPAECGVHRPSGGGPG